MIQTNPCLVIPRRFCNVFEVSFKSLSMRSNCLLVLLVSKAGGGLAEGLGWNKWAERGLLLSFPLPMDELFTAVR